MAAPTHGVSAVAIGAMATGAVLVWSGIRGSSPFAAVQDIIKGEKPKGQQIHPIDSTVAAAPAGGSGGPVGAGASGIVGKAMAHQGKHPYVFGGGHGGGGFSNCAAGRPLDCSGFASCVLHELGLLSSPLNTTGFLAWRGAQTVPWEQRDAGDLIIWPQHMGIAVSPTQMIHTGGSSGCPCVVPYSRTRSGRVGVARRVKGAVTTTDHGVKLRPAPGGGFEVLP